MAVAPPGSLGGLTEPGLQAGWQFPSKAAKACGRAASLISWTSANDFFGAVILGRK